LHKNKLPSLLRSRDELRMWERYGRGGGGGGGSFFAIMTGKLVGPEFLKWIRKKKERRLNCQNI